MVEDDANHGGWRQARGGRRGAKGGGGEGAAATAANAAAAVSAAAAATAARPALSWRDDVRFDDEQFTAAPAREQARRIAHLRAIIERHMTQLSSSPFFTSLVATLDASHRGAAAAAAAAAAVAASSSPPLDLVCYGIGPFRKSRPAQVQLACFLLLARHVHERVDATTTRPSETSPPTPPPSTGTAPLVHLYDPVLTALERCVARELGVTVLEHNEECRRAVSRPTLFFMPHCGPALYNNVLSSNWSHNALRNVLLLGNSLTEIVEKQRAQQPRQTTSNVGASSSSSSNAVRRRRNRSGAATSATVTNDSAAASASTLRPCSIHATATPDSLVSVAAAQRTGGGTGGGVGASSGLSACAAPCLCLVHELQLLRVVRCDTVAYDEVGAFNDMYLHTFGHVSAAALQGDDDGNDRSNPQATQSARRRAWLASTVPAHLLDSLEAASSELIAKEDAGDRGDTVNDPQSAGAASTTTATTPIDVACAPRPIAGAQE